MFTTEELVWQLVALETTDFFFVSVYFGAFKKH